MSDITARLHNSRREADLEMNRADREDAADEIERLRTEVEYLDSVIDVCPRCGDILESSRPDKAAS